MERYIISGANSSGKTYRMAEQLRRDISHRVLVPDLRRLDTLVRLGVQPSQIIVASELRRPQDAEEVLELSEVLGDDLYDEMEFSVDEEEPVLPVTLQLIKEEFDRTADNSRCNPDPNYDLENYLKDVGLPSDTRPADEVLVIDCPHCGRASFYNGGFTATCACCGYYNLADHSDEAYTLADYWCRKDGVPF